MAPGKTKCPVCGHLTGVPLLLDAPGHNEPNMACTRCRHQWHDPEISTRATGNGGAQDDAGDGSGNGDGGGDGGGK